MLNTAVGAHDSDSCAEALNLAKRPRGGVVRAANPVARRGMVSTGVLSGGHLHRALLSIILMRVIADIRKHLELVPFTPFTVRTADGREYPVPTIDHVYLPP